VTYARTKSSCAWWGPFCIAWILLGFACNDGSGGSDATRAGRTYLLSADARQLTDQLLSQLGDATAYAVKDAAAQEAAGIEAVLGLDGGRLFNAHLARGCESEEVSGETCLVLGSSPEAQKLNGCFRTGCDGPDQPFVDVYVTTGERTPEDLVPLSYRTEEPLPSGTITYNPAPFVRWHTDARSSMSLDVHADLQASLVAQLPSERIDLSYVGRATGRSVPGHSYNYDIVLTFPSLSPTGELSASIIRTSEDKFSVEILDGETRIASFVDGALVWCAESAVDCV